jgi:hypothetical protein
MNRMSQQRFRYDARMTLCRVLLGVVVVAACTKPNKAKQCMDGTCTRPEFPFCDVTGFASGEPGTCVAVTCSPGEFGECRGDYEVRCNGDGTNFEVVQCERGCDAAAGGCRLCNANETACTNGTLATCNENGAVISSDVCPLGCFEDQPRCRDVDPSNDLGRFLDMVPDAPDLDLSGGATIETSTGTVTTASGSMTVPSFRVPAPADGAAIRVIVAGRVRLGAVTIVPAQTFTTDAPALAILASDEITVEGRVTATDSDWPTAGGVALAGCTGSHVAPVELSGPTQQLKGGDGGGGHATAGARGGGVDPQAPGGAGGSASGTAELVPLRGGCAASGGVIVGGGAIQLSSRKSIDVTGVIDVNGGMGGPEQTYVYGGGAGGGILLEAPLITLGPEAKLLANGGGGASCSAGGIVSETLSPSTGGGSSDTYCGAGGNGAAAGVEATPGATAPYTNSASVMFLSGGGGGGGLGYVRINTRDGTYMKSNTSIEAAVVTTGILATR